MEPSYRILKSPATETRARFFETDLDQESKFLEFSSALKTRSENFRNYINLTTICGVYVFRCASSVTFRDVLFTNICR
jgi:hypothetical protein